MRTHSVPSPTVQLLWLRSHGLRHVACSCGFWMGMRAAGEVHLPRGVVWAAAAGAASAVSCEARGAVRAPLITAVRLVSELVSWFGSCVLGCSS